MLEHEIEDYGITYAEVNGFETRKMAYAGRRGCRDRDFYGYGHCLRVEFKRPNKPLDAHQDREATRLKAKGLITYVVDSTAKIEQLLDWAKANPVTEARCNSF